MPKPLSVLVEATSGKRSVTDGEQDGQKGRRKHIKSQLGGTKDDVTMGGTSSGQKGSAKGVSKSTDAKLHNAVLETLCVLSQQVREVRGAVFMCWMIKQEAPEYKKPTEQLRAYSELAATKGKGHGLGPPGIAAFTGLLQVLSERGSAVGAADAAGVANLKQTWDDMEPEGGLRFVGTLLQAGQSVRPSSEPPRTRHQRGTTPRTHSWGARTNRSESSSRSSSKRSFGTGTVSSDRTELKKVNFVAASRPDSPIRPRLRQVEWRQGIASDKELMDRAIGKLVGTGGSAVSSTSGQVPTSAEIEEVRGLSCGALDPEFDAEEDAAREMHSQSDL